MTTQPGLKFEQIRVELVPRSNGHCIDLGLRFLGHYVGSTLLLVALTLIPLAMICWIDQQYLPGLGLVNWPLLFLLSGPLGVALTALAVRVTFGETITLWTTWRECVLVPWSLHLGVLLLRLCTLLAGILFFFPGFAVAVRWGFMTESRLLKKLTAERQGHSTANLVGQHLSEMYIRSTVLQVFWGLLSVVLFCTLDCLARVLLGWNILLGRLSELGAGLDGEPQFDAVMSGLWSLLISDPASQLTLATSFLLAYCITRLAWYFFYLDLRVRSDCWDLELELTDTVRQLVGARS